ncbi:MULTISPECIES: helix-turn-helix transcriptional regulator [unclassified Dysgonomonas]|uniref:helix-turn-helix domain-containing protein n=1 Tax=unclassified Dysgonomonas TaxID=2630389 RepID=UPI0025C22A25|nr:MULTISPECIES: helix-turn-helix transcriptional regulator [unclassified Dysgonomonas]HMM02031.1 helix-turn-helix transcriptional regulator [Dysgonomonas sp.]
MLRINEIRKEKGFTLKELADKIGISLSGINQQISGNPTLETLEKIASALNVEVWELFTPSVSKEELTALVDHRGRLYKANSIEELQGIIEEIKKEPV